MENLSRIAFLVGLIGEDESEKVLTEHVKGRLSGQLGTSRLSKKLLNNTLGIGKGGSNSSREGEKFARWTEEEKAATLAKAAQLFAETKNWASVARELSKTTNRSISSLFNFLYNSGLTKQYAAE